MKKFIALALVMITSFCLALTGCSEKTEKDEITTISIINEVENEIDEQDAKYAVWKAIFDNVEFGCWREMVKAIEVEDLSKTDDREAKFFARFIMLLEDMGPDEFVYTVSFEDVHGDDTFCVMMTDIVELYNKEYNTHYIWMNENYRDTMVIYTKIDGGK